MSEHETPRIQAIKQLRGEIQKIFRIPDLDERHKRLTSFCRLLVDYSSLTPHDTGIIAESLDEIYN